eukprot:1391968-Amorphochlora_amoeboformis.AAC.1
MLAEMLEFQLSAMTWVSVVTSRRSNRSIESDVSRLTSWSWMRSSLEKGATRKKGDTTYSNMREEFMRPITPIPEKVDRHRLQLSPTWCRMFPCRSPKGKRKEGRPHKVQSDIQCHAPPEAPPPNPCTEQTKLKY